MRINIQKILRVTIPVFAAFLILFTSVFSVSADSVTGAVPVNYRDYITNVTVDGNNDIVRISIPLSFFEIGVSTGGWAYVNVASGGFIRFNSTNHGTFQIVISPFGDRLHLSSTGPFDGRYLSLSNIPSDASFSFGFQCTIDNGSPSIFVSRYANNYVNGGAVVKNGFVSMPFYGDQIEGGVEYSAYVSGSFGGDYEGWFPVFNVGINGVPTNTNVTIEVKSFTIDLTINSYYRVLEEMGYSDQIDDLEQQLAEQGKKLDDILNGSAEDQESANQFGGASSDQADKMDGMNDAMNSVDKPDAGNINMDISDYVTGADVATYLPFMAVLVTSPHVVNMMVVLLTVSVIAYVLFGKRS